MKKFFILASSLIISTSAFATLSDNEAGGKLITGDYTISELKEANGDSLEFVNIVLDGSITIDDSTAETASVIKTTTASSKLISGLSSTYSFCSQNGATLNLKAGSKSSFDFASSINSFAGPLVINVDKDAGGYIYTERVASQKKKEVPATLGAAVTLNLDKAYAIRTSDKDKSFTAMIVGTLNINATADQSMDLDMRSGGKMNVNLSNGANLFLGVNKIFGAEIIHI